MNLKWRTITLPFCAKLVFADENCFCWFKKDFRSAQTRFVKSTQMFMFLQWISYDKIVFVSFTKFVFAGCIHTQTLRFYQICPGMENYRYVSKTSKLAQGILGPKGKQSGETSLKWTRSLALTNQLQGCWNLNTERCGITSHTPVTSHVGQMWH